MIGMDRLTEETSAHRAVLDWIKEDAPIGLKMMMTPDLANKLSARIAHRRASQAAPDPVAWLVEDLHRASRPPIFATISRKNVEGIFSDPDEFKVTPLYAAPAQSDGLREAALAVEQWWLTEGMYAFNGAPNAMFRLRAALSASPAQEGEPRHD